MLFFEATISANDCRLNNKKNIIKSIFITITNIVI